MAVSKENSAPYAPGSAILDIIDRYRNRGLSKPFTPDVLARAGVSDSLIPRTLQALLTLELVTDDGMPTETMESLRRATEGDFKSQLAAWLRNVYADVFAFVEPTDSETAIRDAFRAYNPVGQQPRMVSLFIALCRAAGLRPDDTTKESRPRPNARKSTGITASTGRMKVSGQKAQMGNTAVNSVLPAPLAGLLQSLPADGEWTKADRDKFVATFNTVLDFCIAITSKKKVEEVAE
jgi:hypothetical protein